MALEDNFDVINVGEGVSYIFPKPERVEIMAKQLRREYGLPENNPFVLNCLSN